MYNGSPDFIIFFVEFEFDKMVANLKKNQTSNSDERLLLYTFFGIS